MNQFSPGPPTSSPVPSVNSCSNRTPGRLFLTLDILAAIVLLMMAVGLWTFDSASAQTVPSLINYQGRLSDSNGAALPTADYRLTFNIYDTSLGGTLIWGPQVFDGTAGLGHGSKIPVVQ